jgi:hypothetical protein
MHFDSQTILTNNKNTLQPYVATPAQYRSAITPINSYRCSKQHSQANASDWRYRTQQHHHQSNAWHLSLLPALLLHALCQLLHCNTHAVHHQRPPQAPIKTNYHTILFAPSVCTH